MAAEETERYTIAAKAGPKLEDQIKLADWHCLKTAQINVREALLAGPIVEEMDRLLTRLTEIRDRAEHERAFHKNALEWWVLEEDLREKLGKSFTLPHGKVKTRQTAGKTEINEEMVLELADHDPANYADLVVQSVNRGAARERFHLNDDGSVTDKVTGEVLAQGLIRQVGEPHVVVTVEAEGGLEE